MIDAALWGLAIAIVMFAAGLVWEQREQERRSRQHNLTQLELRRKSIVAVFAGFVAFLLALVAYSA